MGIGYTWPYTCVTCPAPKALGFAPLIQSHPSKGKQRAQANEMDCPSSKQINSTVWDRSQLSQFQTTIKERPQQCPGHQKTKQNKASMRHSEKECEDGWRQGTETTSWSPARLASLPVGPVLGGGGRGRRMTKQVPRAATLPSQHPGIARPPQSPLFITAPGRREPSEGPLRPLRQERRGRTLIEAGKREFWSLAAFSLPGAERRGEESGTKPCSLGCLQIRLRAACSSGELLIEICGMKWATAVCLDKYILCYMPQPPSVC